MKDDFNILIGQRIRKCRRDKDITQAKLARLIDGTSQQVNNWETGLRSVSVHYLRQLAGVFGCTIGYLAGDIEALPARGPIITAENNLLAPMIQSGDLVEIDTSITATGDAGVFAIKRDNDEVILRWLVPDAIGAGATISVTNPTEWESTHIHDISQLNILGKAVLITRKI